MQSHHWVMLVVILLVGYFIGVLMPGTGNRILGR